jgi:hypothetical protein
LPTEDEKNLDLLGTLHYVMGALTALFACIPIVHLVIGIAMLTGNLNGEEVAPRAIGMAFVILASIIILAGWLFAVLIIIAGSRLKQRRSYNYCLIIAFLECLIMPLGTVLGIFTILNLNKDTVKELFNR